MNAMDEWVGRVCTALGLEPTDYAPVLDMTRDVAHQVLRPAAPVTAYLLGVAVGQGADPASAASLISELAKSWSAERGGGDPAS